MNGYLTKKRSDQIPYYGRMDPIRVSYCEELLPLLVASNEGASQYGKILVPAIGFVLSYIYYEV